MNHVFALVSLSAREHFQIETKTFVVHKHDIPLSRLNIITHLDYYWTENFCVMS